MKCFFCTRGMATGDTLYRINAKGEPGIWACDEHRRDVGAPAAPEVADIVEAVTGKRPKGDEAGRAALAQKGE